jgi:hypothetical protein
VVYGVSVAANAWGFLAVFFAGVALRQTELVLAGAHKDRQGLMVPDRTPKPGNLPARRTRR